MRGATETRDGAKKTGEQPFKAPPPSYIFMLLYQDERLLIGVLHSCYIVR